MGDFAETVTHSDAQQPSLPLSVRLFVPSSVNPHLVHLPHNYDAGCHSPQHTRTRRRRTRGHPHSPRLVPPQVSPRFQSKPGPPSEHTLSLTNLFLSSSLQVLLGYRLLARWSHPPRLVSPLSCQRSLWPWTDIVSAPPPFSGATQEQITEDILLLAQLTPRIRL